MNRYFLRKRIFAVIFIVTILGFFGVNMLHSYATLKDEVQEQIAEESLDVPALETEITETLYGRMNFIETYGFAQVLMDKREMNNFSMLKDENGYLHYASFYTEPDSQLMEYAMRLKRLKDYANQQGTQVLFVMTPSKYSDKNSSLRTGLPVNDPTATVNELLFYMNRLGVDTLNLGEFMPNDEISYDEVFFKTDHHWTIPASFYATQKLVEKMETDLGASFTNKNYYFNLGNYDIQKYFGGMLGSMGRRTGIAFSGTDDFVAYWPKFDGNFTRESMDNNGGRLSASGSFQEVFMSPEVLNENKDIYSSSQYGLYLNELRIYEKIINNDNPEGSKIFMIRDSYFSPVISFMMPMCGEIDAIWSLETLDSLDIESYIKENDFDYIVMEVYPYNINDAAFNFFKEN